MHRKLRLWLTGLVLSLVPTLALAAGTGAMDQVQSALQGKILPWQSIMQTAATDLFYALAAVEFSVLFLNHILNRRGHEDLFASIIKKVVTLGFFLTVLDNSGTWIPAIINGLAGGAHALGVTAVTPSRIATEALQTFLGVAFAPLAAAKHNAGSFFGDLFSGNLSGAVGAFGKLVASSNPVSLILELLISAIIGLLAGIGVLIMALEFLMVEIESYLVIALGVIMLAGGGLRWTAKYVGSYFDYAINVGVRLFILTALAYLVTYSIVPLIQTEMENVTNPLQMGFTVLILGAVIALLPKKASSIANSLLSGKSSFSGGELAKEGAGVAAGTVLAGAGVAAGGVALAGAAGGMGAGSLGAAAGAGGASGGAGTLGAAAGSGLGEAGSSAGMLGGAEGMSDGVAVPADLMKNLGGPGGDPKGGPADNGAPAPKLADLPKFDKADAGTPKPAQSGSSGSGEDRESAAQRSDGTASTDQTASSAGEQASGNDGAPAPVGVGLPAAGASTAADVSANASARTATAAATRPAARAGQSGAAQAGADTGNASGDAAQSSGGAAPAADHGAPAPSADPGAASTESPSPAGGQASGNDGAPAMSAPTDNGAPVPKPATLDDVVKAIKEGQQPTKKSLGERLMDYAGKRGIEHFEEHLGGKPVDVSGKGIDTSHGND
ncbi:P-type conjugative transfer protein TrbL [Acidithiobacillus caldus]|uniref:P-type conjugative transfer protein TrbL n=1 Tax=Acidithiobacillus caldus TaxID=33059 RepID=UPI001C07E7ED|nr:P-type conjugative transfer protein TrbL [Acidithiobacillus caldus]MBU2791520.1 P-type conjugative transfer protein TrbL [Acidithiobacillus caldus]